MPCKDRFFLDKCLTIIKPGLEEISGLTNGESSYFGITTELYSGTMQLSMGYIDTQNVTPDKEQMAVMQNVLSDKPDENYAGFVVLQLLQTSLHVFAAYLLPQFRHGELLQQGFDNIEKQARLLGAPYLSLCTKEHELVKRLGFSPTYTTYRKKL